MVPRADAVAPAYGHRPGTVTGRHSLPSAAPGPLAGT